MHGKHACMEKPIAGVLKLSKQPLKPEKINSNPNSVCSHEKRDMFVSCLQLIHTMYFTHGRSRAPSVHVHSKK